MKNTTRTTQYAQLELGCCSRLLATCYNIVLRISQSSYKPLPPLSPLACPPTRRHSDTDTHSTEHCAHLKFEA